MAKILQIDIYLYALIILIFMLIYLMKERSKKDISSAFFIGIVLSNSLMLILESTTWVLDGLEGTLAYAMNNGVNWILLTLNIVPITAWLIYFDYKIFMDIEVLKKRVKIYIIPNVFLLGMMLLNPMNHFVYRISEDNRYIRGTGTFVIGITAYLVLIFYFIWSRKYRKLIDGRLIHLCFILAFFPMIGAFIQMMYYGATLIWPMTTLVVLIAFVYIEREDMLKDTLTFLATRSQFEQRLKFKLRKKLPFSLIMLDMDDFKSINDTYGHDEGDEALRIMANLLLQSVKRSDFVCRYAGDEFMLIVESTDEIAGHVVLKRITSSLVRFNHKKVKPYFLSASMGLYFVDTPNVENMRWLLGEVDSRMYEDKRKKQRSKDN